MRKNRGRGYTHTTPEIITADTVRFQCRHLFNDGRRRGSPAVRAPEGADSFGYYHHNSRRWDEGGTGVNNSCANCPVQRSV